MKSRGNDCAQFKCMMVDAYEVGRGRHQPGCGVLYSGGIKDGSWCALDKSGEC